MRENRLLRLPDFDINSKTSEFSLMTTILSVIIICIIMTFVVLAFYKIRRLSVILAALSSPLATQAYVFEYQAPCPIPLECSKVEDVWITSGIILTAVTAMVIIALTVVLWYMYRSRYSGNKTQVLLQVSTGPVMESIFVTTLQFPTTTGRNG